MESVKSIQIKKLQKIYNSMTNTDLKIFLEWFVKDRLIIFNWKDSTTVKIDEVNYFNSNIQLTINDTPEYNETSRTGHYEN
jgi:hypothetical protein